MAKKRRGMVGKGSKSQLEIQRHWGDVQVIDAKKDLRVFIKPEDVATAKSKDPGCCIFAQACKRQFAATKVLFWRCVAYVELPGPDGKRRVERFELSRDMRQLIEDFDRGNTVPLSAGFELKRVRPHMTFEGKRKKNNAYLERKKRAAIKGTSEGSASEIKGQGKGAYSKPAIVIDLEVRDGRGMVQFKKTADAS